MALTFLAPMAHDARFPGTGTVGVYIVAGLTLVFVRLIFVQLAKQVIASTG